VKDHVAHVVWFPCGKHGLACEGHGRLLHWGDCPVCRADARSEKPWSGSSTSSPAGRTASSFRPRGWTLSTAASATVDAAGRQGVLDELGLAAHRGARASDLGFGRGWYPPRTDWLEVLRAMKGRPFVYLLPRRWWWSVGRNAPYFTVGLWLLSFGYLRPEEDVW